MASKAHKPTKKASKSTPKQPPCLIHASKTASHFGFVPYNSLEIEKQDISKAKNFKDGLLAKKSSLETNVLDFEGYLEEKIAIIRHYIEKKMIDLNQPPMIYYEGPIAGNPHIKKREKTFNIDIIGNGKSISDAIIIETTCAILRDLNPDSSLLVEINSIGDKESFNRFSREYINYYKKHLNELPAEERQVFKKNPFDLLMSTHEVCQHLNNEAPHPMNYLSEESREHFREVLEYIESLNIQYSINHCLIGNGSFCSGTIFRVMNIIDTDESEERVVCAIGERYNVVARKAWGKKEVPAIGASIILNEKHKNITEKNTKAPAKKKNADDTRFFFIQLGYDARLKSLTIIDMLRGANIHVHQSLSRDKISAQMAAAEKINAHYLLIVGQKEAIENSVTIRHMNTLVQETIAMANLIAYLKKLM